MARSNTSTDTRRVDPRSAHPRPPFTQKEPGTEDVDSLEPRPDHGEESYVGSGRLVGLRTVITGGDSGIGRAVAIAFAREGADVLIAYRTEHEDAAETARLVEGAGRRGIAVAADVSDEASCRQLVERANDEFGAIDVLVNNAAMQRPRAAIEEITTEEWERTLRTNLTGPFLLCREAVRFMGPGGSIINVVSIQAVHPSPSLLVYATTKGGLVTFSKGLSAMLAARGIRVNLIAPGPVWTPLVATTTAPEELEHFGEGSAFGRPAQPAELAGAFVYLASPEASYVTGATIAVTGGDFFS
jgi:NAD(P)-dependent dehydrogenase (short-subunit alcohol dehydrogenase family)